MIHKVQFSTDAAVAEQANFFFRFENQGPNVVRQRGTNIKKERMNWPGQSGIPSPPPRGARPGPKRSSREERRSGDQPALVGQQGRPPTSAHSCKKNLSRAHRSDPFWAFGEESVTIGLAKQQRHRLFRFRSEAKDAVTRHCRLGQWTYAHSRLPRLSPVSHTSVPPSPSRAHRR